MAAPASHRGRSRRRSWWLLFFAILVLHSLAIYLFTRGFLLTRTELDLHSHRDDRTGVSPGCSSWPPPAVDRLVVVVLDAIRSPRLAFSVPRTPAPPPGVESFLDCFYSWSWLVHTSRNILMAIGIMLCNGVILGVKIRTRLLLTQLILQVRFRGTEYILPR